MGGGGGILNKMCPGYKEKIWNKLPLQTRRSLIQRQHSKFENDLFKTSVSSVSSVEKYNNFVKRWAPNYESRAPVVDYKRQFVRGTLIEGRDSYLPTKESQTRLINLESPYSESEEAARENLTHYDLKLLVGVLLAGFIVHDFNQTRPLVWCLGLPPAPPRYPWHHRAIHRSYDVKSIRRGWEVFRAVCSSCHSVKKARYWFLMKDLYPTRRVQEFAAEKTCIDGLTNDGELNIRPCFTWDNMPRTYPTHEAAQEANGGKMPPDFSEGAYFYRGGPDYIFSILTGYHPAPVGFHVPAGTYYNVWYSGNLIGMPPPLDDGLVDYEDGTPATVSQMAKDVCGFLCFIGEPSLNERKIVWFKFAFGLLMVFPFLYHMRRTCLGGGWTRTLQFDKLKYI